MKRIIGVFVYLSLSISLLSQSITTPATPILRFLYNQKEPISIISNTEKMQLFPLIVGKANAKFKLIKNKTGLFVLVDGTGLVYKATNLRDNLITYTRIDSTTFFGNNFLSINYSYNDTLYSFGGYGFWQMNGQLIHFNPGAEWSIDMINKRYNTTNYLCNYLPEDGKIYYVEQPREEEATNEKRDKFLTVEFDLKKKENKLLGKINPVIDLVSNDFTINIPSLDGVLLYTNRGIYLFNFKENKIFKLINSKVQETLLRNSEDFVQTTFFSEGKIYFSYLKDTNLYSVDININDFKEENYPLYIKNDNRSNLLIPSLLIIVLFICIYIFKRRFIKRNPIRDTNTESIYSNDLNTNEFNSIETTLIDKLIEKSNNNSHLTVDEMNTILGIKKKTIEIQKRVRTETIIRVNHKFNINFNVETTFIERTRSAEDRRYFNYVINKENARIYLKK